MNIIALPPRVRKLCAAAGAAALATGMLTTSTLLAPAVLAAGAAQISEIAYAGPDDTDFIEITGDPGTDVSGWTVGSVTRGGSVQSANHVTTLPAGSVIPDSGVLVVELPITNSVNGGSAADGSYGSSAFVIDASGRVLDFDQIGGVVGGKGVTGGGGATTPEAIGGIDATPTGAVATGGSSIQLVDGAWIAGAPTPGESSVGDSTPDPEPTEPDPTQEPTDPPEPGEVTPIAQIQGTEAESALVGQTVTTRGVVTAAYPTGGLNGYYIQTEGTGGATDATPGASDGIFVYSSATVAQVETGDFVEVTGAVSEYFGLTQLSVSGGNATVLSEPAEAAKPVEGAFPDDAAEREALEGMLAQPTGPVTVTDNYSTNSYGEIGLANGTETLRQPTDVFRPGSAEAEALAAENADRLLILDDGSSWNYTRDPNKDTPVPYLSNTEPVRVGAEATFTSPVIVSYGFDAWRFQPTEQLTGAGSAPVSFENTREAAPQPVGGEISAASFNVLNYFTTTGDQLEGCDYYTDREGNPVTVSGGCDARGAADAENLQRQQVKIVNAINTLDASVVSLEEIENSAAFGKDRDAALAILVDALNAAAGTDKWAFVESPAELPASEDVIRTAFIYQPAQVAPQGEATILADSEAFGNAREPLAQAFAPLLAGSTADEAAPAVDESKAFVAIVNHFKSKGSGSGEGNTDTGDGQGASNADRVEQAEALTGFAEEQSEAAGTEHVILLGDFNSYGQEDPMQVFYEAGYANVGHELVPSESTYLFSGLVGSLDHVLLSPSLMEEAQGADIWNINSVESVALEYSRYNNNATLLYDETVFRSSDHDPLLVGLFATEDDPGTDPTADPTTDPTSDPTSDPITDPTAPGIAPTDGTDDATGAPSDQPVNGPGDDNAGQPGNSAGAGSAGADSASGSGSGSDSQGASGNDSSSLPRTGAEMGAAIAAGLVLVAAGVIALRAARRKQ